MKRILKYIAYTLLIFISVILFFAGRIATHIINDNGEKIIGRKVSIDDIHINYLKSSIEIEDLKIYEPDQIQEFASLKRFYVNLKLYKLIQNELVIEQVDFENFNINIKRKRSNTFNFDDIIAFYSSDSISDQPKEESNPLHFKISNIELNNINIAFDDQIVNEQTGINNLHIGIPYIGWNQKKYTDADFKFSLNNGGEIASNININPTTGSFNTTVRISNFNLHDLTNYLKNQILVNDLKGTFSSTIKAKGNFNDFNSILVDGDLSIENFKLIDKSNTELTSINSIKCDVQHYAIQENQLSIDKLVIDSPHTVVSIIDNKVNWSKIFPRRESKKTNKKIDTTNTKNAFSYKLNHFELRNGSVNYTDNLFTNQFKYELNNINVSSDSLSSTNDWIKTDTQIGLNKTGTIDNKFNINIETGEYQFNGKIKQLNLSDFDPIIKSFLNISSVNGSLNSRLKLVGNYNQNQELDIEGNLDIQDLELSKNNVTLASVNSLHTKINKIRLKENQFILDSIILNKPYINVYIDSTYNSFSNLVVEKQSDSIQKTEQDVAIEKPIYYTIRSVRINNGKIDYEDHLTNKDFKYQIDRMHLKSKHISSLSKWITIDFDSRLNKRGKFDGQTSFNPNDLKTSNLKFSMENVDLTDFNAYSNYYIGHHFNKGYLYYYSDSDVEKGKLKSSNKFLIRNNDVETTGEGLYDVPLKVAFYLSTNSDKNVEISVPIEGDLNNPNVNVTTLITRTFTNIIFKIVSSPTNIVSSIVVGKKDVVDEIPLITNQVALSDKQEDLLNKLVKTEKKNKNIFIELIYKSNDSAQLPKNTNLLIKRTMDYLQKKNKSTEIYIVTSKDSIHDNLDKLESKYIINYYSKNH